MDGRALYLGSLNFDPRSELYNTEMGVIIFSPELAGQLRSLVALITRETAYRVRQGSEGVEWSSPNDDGGGDEVQHEEPETSAWKRLLLKLLGPFVPESML